MTNWVDRSKPDLLSKAEASAGAMPLRPGTSTPQYAYLIRASALVRGFVYPPMRYVIYLLFVGLMHHMRDVS